MEADVAFGLRNARTEAAFCFQPIVQVPACGISALVVEMIGVVTNLILVFRCQRSGHVGGFGTHDILFFRRRMMTKAIGLLDLSPVCAYWLNRPMGHNPAGR